MSEKSIKNSPTSNNHSAPKRAGGNLIAKVNIYGNCLIQDSIPFFHGNVINIQILFTNNMHGQSRWFKHRFHLGKCLSGTCLFGAVNWCTL